MIIFSNCVSIKKLLNIWIKDISCIIFTTHIKQDSKIRMYDYRKTINLYKSHRTCPLLFSFDLVLQPKQYR